MEHAQIEGLDALVEYETIERVAFALWIICLRKTMRRDSLRWQRCADVMRTAFDDLIEISPNK